MTTFRKVSLEDITLAELQLTSRELTAKTGQHVSLSKVVQMGLDAIRKALSEETSNVPEMVVYYPVVRSDGSNPRMMAASDLTFLQRQALLSGDSVSIDSIEYILSSRMLITQAGPVNV